MIKKLRQKKGETLVDTMVSLLIAVLSVVMLSTAVLTTTKINQQTREMDERFNAQLLEAEGLDNSVKKKNVQISIRFSSLDDSAVYENSTAEVLLYGNPESDFLSYDYKPEGVFHEKD